jgi:hypothetical protein
MSLFISIRQKSTNDTRNRLKKKSSGRVEEFFYLREHHQKKEKLSVQQTFSTH